LTKAWIAALRAANKREDLRDLLARSLSAASSVNAVRYFATVAFSESFSDLAAGGYDRVLAARPNDRDALKHRGQIAFFGGDFSTAEPLLRRYVSLAGDKADYRSLFQLGEINRTKRRYDAAETFYERALAAIKVRSRPDTGMRITRAMINHRLGRDGTARDEFERLMADGSTRGEAVPYYTQMLLDEGKLDAVRAILHETGA
jgi:tetratricopeptide (TPR) repeat protein